MPYKRLVMNEPPTEETMNQLEAQGWTRIDVVGPALGLAQGASKPTPVFIVYMWRSVIIAADGVHGSVRGLN